MSDDLNNGDAFTLKSTALGLTDQMRHVDFNRTNHAAILAEQSHVNGEALAPYLDSLLNRRAENPPP